MSIGRYTHCKTSNAIPGFVKTRNSFRASQGRGYDNISRLPCVIPDLTRRHSLWKVHCELSQLSAITLDIETGATKMETETGF